MTAASPKHKTRMFDCIISVWFHLHCLPASHRRRFKIPLLVFKVIHILDPICLCKRLTLKRKGGLRSDNTLVPIVPLIKLKLKTHGRFFSIGGSVLWNELPGNIRLSDIHHCLIFIVSSLSIVFICLFMILQRHVINHIRMFSPCILQMIMFSKQWIVFYRHVIICDVNWCFV